MTRTVYDKIIAAHEHALAIYKKNKADGADAVSVAFDAGRVDGLSQALSVIETAARESSR